MKSKKHKDPKIVNLTGYRFIIENNNSNLYYNNLEFVDPEFTLLGLPDHSKYAYLDTCGSNVFVKGLPKKKKNTIFIVTTEVAIFALKYLNRYDLITPNKDIINSGLLIFPPENSRFNNDLKENIYGYRAIEISHFNNLKDLYKDKSISIFIKNMVVEHIKTNRFYQITEVPTIGVIESTGKSTYSYRSLNDKDYGKIFHREKN